MLGVRTEVLCMACVWVAMVILECNAMKMDLSQLLGNRMNAVNPSQKRVVGGNPCTQPEKPWPCLTTDTCLPMRYICDDNYDCEDGSDEDIDMCTAKARPPVEDIHAFLESQKDWIIPYMFDGKPIGKVAHTLAVSQSVHDFKRRLGMSSKGFKNLEAALKYIKKGREEDLEDHGMPASAWNEVNFFFLRLIKNGFA